MGTEITVTIDGRQIHCARGSYILDAADQAGIYIPRLCRHPDLPPGPGARAEARVFRHGESIVDHGAGGKTYAGCNICLVEVEGMGIRASCSTEAAEGMNITTDSQTVKRMRKDNMTLLLARHPHACIMCAEREGCDREECTQGVDRNCRCCDRFDECEFRLVSEYVGVRQDVSQYVSPGLPAAETPFFTFDANRCIGCTRCVRACEKMRGSRAIGFVSRDGSAIVGTLGPSHRESGCVFCGACVMVCPAGALTDRGHSWPRRDELRLSPVKLPPEDGHVLTEENIDIVPDVSGVYELLDGNRTVVYIRGAASIRGDLKEKWKTVENARFFRYEEHGMFTMRENELLEKFLKKHGRMPDVNNEIEDLY
jgi:ferredoxin